ncbi:MerR family transcriptional regulator [Diplocloster agilis]|uniref:MerR family transcriptional regulator n=1 Tax=Diplocloster agilis TaxID=2850323 RepID=A0A949K244_9FIRM|nr:MULTISPECIES: MerR family transcriptional regulator [Lachnospiraceae]MBU9737922.1 MerR family transcriptional regulator [Diplocloster agilis]MCU6732733.1 MerR family transcriptional regulator [Suonthocola fibrivorans]SCI58568.1 Multidrug transporter activation protein [uncultured Clostridium sp.]
MKTVKDVSEITGVSIRTLRYYDEIGLLKPTKLTDSGYRLYDNRALEKLQQIMFFRELEIPLAEIKEIMGNPDFDKKQVLAVQKSLLESKRNRLNGIIELIHDVMEGVNTMNFKAFNETDVEQIIAAMQKELSEEQFEELIKTHGDGSVDEYKKILLDALENEKVSADLLRWFGSKDKVIAGMAPIENIEEKRLDHNEIYRQLAALQTANDEEAERNLIGELADSYKQLLHLDNARAFLIDLSKEYLQDKKLAEANDAQYGKGSAEYIAKAIRRYYGV